MRRTILLALGAAVTLAGAILFLVHLRAMLRGDFAPAGSFGAAALVAGLPALSAGALAVRTGKASASILLNLSLVFGAVVWIALAWYLAAHPGEHGRLWPYAVAAAGLEGAAAFGVGFPTPAPDEHSSAIFKAWLKSLALGIAALIVSALAVAFIG